MSFPVDLTDRADIRAKLPQAREILARRQRDLEAAAREVRVWERVLANLELLAGETDPFSVIELDPEVIDPDMDEPIERDEAEDAGDGTAAAGTTDLVVEVVNRADRAIRSKDVRETLSHEGHDLTNDQVANALYYAATNLKSIARTGRRGYYAPLLWHANGEPDDEPTRPVISSGFLVPSPRAQEDARTA
jgi:hypothetical protein